MEIGDAHELDRLAVANPEEGQPPAALFTDHAFRAEVGAVPEAPRQLGVARNSQGYRGPYGTANCETSQLWSSFWNGIWGSDTTRINYSATNGFFSRAIARTPTHQPYERNRVGGCASGGGELLQFGASYTGNVDPNFTFTSSMWLDEDEWGRYWFFWTSGATYWFGAAVDNDDDTDHTGAGASYWKAIPVL